MVDYYREGVMRFKSLHIQGFKSFVDKTDILFPGGLTCVVGPNGSGKSNILDGIRWVFGEQNAKELRGSGMEDVIFSGSQKRKAYGFAEVTLVLADLPEYITSKWGTLSEVAVTRKYYRSGDREYRINNRKCRLKDIKEIFYDAGIGPRSISIIEQGKVDKIIQSSPEDLRVFFEETAGVIKFKERKKDAERRLGQTKDNLSRVSDIISEVRVQMESLEHQAQSVKQYRDLARRKDVLGRGILFSKYQTLVAELKETDDKINAGKIELAALLSKATSMMEKEGQAENKINELRDSLRKTNDEIVSVVNKLGIANGDIKVIQNDLDSSEKTKESLHHRIEDVERKLRDLTAKRVDVLQSKESANTDTQGLKESIETASERMEELCIQKDDLNDELMELEHEYLKLMEQSTAFKNKIFEYETILNSAEADIKRLLKEKTEAEEELFGVEDKAKSFGERKEELTYELEIVNEKVSFLEIELEDAKDENTALKNSLDNAKLEQKELENRIVTLKRQLDDFTNAGSGGSIKELNPSLLIENMNLSGALSVEYGDVLVFSDSEYGKVMSFLKEYDGGLRFTFKKDTHLILENAANLEEIMPDIIKNTGIYRKLGKDDKGVLIASLIEELSSCESLVKTKASVVGSLDIECSEQQEKIDELAVRLDSFKDEKNEIQFELRNIEKDFNDTKNIQERLRKRLNIIESEISRTNHEKEDKEGKLAEMRAKHDESSINAKEKGSEKENIEGRLEELEIMYDDAKDELSLLKIEERGLQEKINSINKELHFIDKDITENTREIASAKDRLSRLLTVDLINLKGRLDARKHDVSELNRLQDELNRRKGVLEHDHDVASKELEEIRALMKDSSGVLKEAENSLNFLQLKKSRVQSDIDNIRENFYEQFSDHVEDQVLDKEFDPQTAKQEMERVKRAINDLGPLNMAAENEYEEIKERYEFLEGQKVDLEDAVGSIYELIREIDESTMMLFKDTFEGVKENFFKVFSILFGKGECDIKLTDPENMLESGVEIYVQPPGKKLQSMNLLSGGEKAMSACTLLFAMFLYRPTPFCFLDEIDAPLDDSNIDKFLKVVRTLSADTQFVIITHNQRTMAEADSLYGITMQEPGVSKLLSVKLEQLGQ